MLLFLLFLLLLLLPFPLIGTTLVFLQIDSCRTDWRRTTTVTPCDSRPGWLAGWLAKSSLVSAGGECPKKKAGEPRSGKRRVSHFHQR
ncbi:uncharacterized protein SRS1_10292 [Sporisorium reilianum f. sp. reilianum]|uniref:Secreted protein n=1 Tax=Sporisorium reilianum f. sp. reilianum TaxID=72559 RepID=A0A2N8U9D3_9BASI|nr:uncharacterized protein SRS1_10292 [Sporisorium reilianum f. sp. reilianum]